MRRVTEGCRRLLSERGESNSVAIAEEILAAYGELTPDQQHAFFKTLAIDFGPNPAAVLETARRYAATPDAAHLLELTRVVEPPRQELLRRLNRATGGTSAIVAMRRTLLERLKGDAELAAVEADFLHLLSSWFNPGFLQMVQVDWRSPAELLEKIIQHEAVHQIEGWDDLRRRLQPDRRCFAFFHPQLPGEPLIFVEVALVSTIPAAISALIDVNSAPQTDDREYKVAAFYSISNCQPGLKGVSLGNFLIKRVAEHLQHEFPRLRTFCTLSPMPGFSAWLEMHAASLPEREDLAPESKQRLRTAWTLLDRNRRERNLLAGSDLTRISQPLRDAIVTLAAFYLARESVTPRGDPVAKFHLGNGARLERLNWAGDQSAKGMRQALGLMVNYLYDLRHIEDNHERFVNGEVVVSRTLQRML